MEAKTRESSFATPAQIQPKPKCAKAGSPNIGWLFNYQKMPPLTYQIRKISGFRKSTYEPLRGYK